MDGNIDLKKDDTQRSKLIMVKTYYKPWKG